MIKESIELSNESIHNLSGLGVFDLATRSRLTNYIQTESFYPESLLGKTVKPQPSRWRKMIHEITEAIALFLIILMRWFDLMRADSNDVALERISNWFWEWLDRECSIANSESPDRSVLK
jgi:hypothetical protein